MRFILLPYVGAGPIKLGMTPEEVTEVLGEHSRMSLAFNGDHSLTYDKLALDIGISKATGVVTHIGFSSVADVWFDEIDVMHDKSALPRLAKLDGAPCEYVGFVMLLNLGIMLGGFSASNEMYQRTVAMFSRGRYDDRRHKFHALRSL